MSHFSGQSFPVLAGIQPAGLCRLGATLSLAIRSIRNPDHILHEHLVRPLNVHEKRLKSRHPFVPAARKLLDDLSTLDIRAAQWTNLKWSMDYLDSPSRLHAFVPKVSLRPLGMGLFRSAWVRLNRLRTGVGRFCSSMHKWGLASSPNCECGAVEQTAEHVILTCPTHRAPNGMRGLTVLDDDTRCWLNTITASI